MGQIERKYLREKKLQNFDRIDYANGILTLTIHIHQTGDELQDLKKAYYNILKKSTILTTEERLEVKRKLNELIR